MSKIRNLKILCFFIGLVSTSVHADKNIVTVGVAPHGGYVILGGTVIPLKEVTLAAQMPGRVESIAGDEGDEFSAGTVLVTTDDDDLQAKKQAASAQLNQAHTALQNAQVQYNRELWNPRVYNPRPMAGMGFPSMFDDMFDNNSFFDSGGNKGIERQADLAAQGSHVETARAQIAAAEAQLREIDAKLRDTKSVAPFDGVIVKKLVEVGDTVQPGVPLLNYSYNKYLRIRAEVPEKLMRGIKKGMIVPARLDASNERISARVAQIAPTADQERHTVTVKFDLPQGVPTSPGAYAEVLLPDVSSPAKALPVIPKSAISRRGSLPSVQVLDENDVPQLRLIRTGDELDEDRITVLSGLKPGERLLVESSSK